MRPVITSLQNPHLKQLAKLRDAKHRRREGQFLIDGIRELNQARLGSIEILELLYDDSQFNPDDAPTDHLEDGEAFADWLRQIPSRQLQPVASSAFERLTYGDRNEGVLAVASIPQMQIERLPTPSPALYVVLDDIEKPGNIGAVLRTAEAAGVTGIILTGKTTDPFHPNAIRASLGGVFRVPLARVERSAAQQWLSEQNVQTLVARVQSSDSLFETMYQARSAIVLGSEADGLGTDWITSRYQGIKIPMFGSIDSLNISVSAAILIYDVIRSRN